MRRLASGWPLIGGWRWCDRLRGHWVPLVPGRMCFTSSRGGPTGPDRRGSMALGRSVPIVKPPGSAGPTWWRIAMTRRCALQSERRYVAVDATSRALCAVERVSITSRSKSMEWCRSAASHPPPRAIRGTHRESLVRHGLAIGCCRRSGTVNPARLSSSKGPRESPSRWSSRWSRELPWPLFSGIQLPFPTGFRWRSSSTR